MFSIYAVLLCLIPVHTCFAQMLGSVSQKQYLETIAIVTTFCIAGCFLLKLFIHNLYLAELIFCIIFFSLLYTNKVYIYTISKLGFEKTWFNVIFRIMYLILTIVFAVFVYELCKGLNLLTFSKIMFYITAFLNITMLFNNVKFEQDTCEIKIEEDCIKIAKKDNLPDIYHIILDCHTGFNNEIKDKYFVEQLKSRGFYVFENFKSNYNMTHLSVPSILNMEYIHNLLNKPENEIYRGAECLKYYGNNKLWSFLENLGYNLDVLLDPFFNDCIKVSSHKINRCKLDYVNQLSRMLCFCSFFSFCLGKIKLSRKLFLQILNQYKNICSQSNKEPSYKMLHLLAPHAPFLFNENGEEFSNKEAVDYSNLVSYQKYINRKTLDLIDNIKQHMKPNSIIVIHGDHGIHTHPKFHNDTLLTVYFPDNDYADIPKNFTAINIFPYILNKYINTKFRMRDNKLYYLSGDSPVKKYYSETPCNKKELTREEVLLYNIEKLAEDLKKKVKLYKNKKVVLYGAGLYFELLKENFDFSAFNILAVSDKKFEDILEPQFDENIGFNVIAPEKIHTLKPDVVLATLFEYKMIKDYFDTVLFKKTGCEFNFVRIQDTKKSYEEELASAWFHALFP